MENKTFYNEILTEHNLHPYHKHKLEDANLVLEGVNPSCGDDIFLELKVEDGVVVDGAFEGDGCAISQASADMMLEAGHWQKQGGSVASGRPVPQDDQGKYYRGRAGRTGGSLRIAGYRPHACQGKMRGAWLAYYAGIIENRRKIADKKIKIHLARPFWIRYNEKRSVRKAGGCACST